MTNRLLIVTLLFSIGALGAKSSFANNSDDIKNFMRSRHEMLSAALKDSLPGDKAPNISPRLGYIYSENQLFHGYHLSSPLSTKVMSDYFTNSVRADDLYHERAGHARADSFILTSDMLSDGQYISIFDSENKTTIQIDAVKKINSHLEKMYGKNIPTYSVSGVKIENISDDGDVLVSFAGSASASRQMVNKMNHGKSIPPTAEGLLLDLEINALDATLQEDRLGFAIISARTKKVKKFVILPHNSSMVRHHRQNHIWGVTNGEFFSMQLDTLEEKQKQAVAKANGDFIKLPDLINIFNLSKNLANIDAGYNYISFLNNSEQAKTQAIGIGNIKNGLAFIARNKKQFNSANIQNSKIEDMLYFIKDSGDTQAQSSYSSLNLKGYSLPLHQINESLSQLNKRYGVKSAKVIDYHGDRLLLSMMTSKNSTFLISLKLKFDPDDISVEVEEVTLENLEPKLNESYFSSANGELLVINTDSERQEITVNFKGKVNTVQEIREVLAFHNLVDNRNQLIALNSNDQIVSINIGRRSTPDQQVKNNLAKPKRSRSKKSPSTEVNPKVNPNQIFVKTDNSRYNFLVAQILERTGNSVRVLTPLGESTVNDSLLFSLPPAQMLIGQKIVNPLDGKVLFKQQLHIVVGVQTTKLNSPLLDKEAEVVLLNAHTNETAFYKLEKLIGSDARFISNCNDLLK